MKYKDYIITFGVFILLAIFILLSIWQYNRWQYTHKQNNLIRKNIVAKHIDFDSLPNDKDKLYKLRYKKVILSGHYTDINLTVTGRSLDEEPGYNILTLFITDTNINLLINRGWVPSTSDPTKYYIATNNTHDNIQIIGRLKPSETYKSTGIPNMRSVDKNKIRLINISTLEKVINTDLYSNYFDLVSKDTEFPIPIRAPNIDDGPYLSYMIQWIVFAIITLVIYIKYFLLKKIKKSRID